MVARNQRSTAPKPTSTAGSRQDRKRLRILFTCVGRRVELLEAFRNAAERLDIKLDIHGADINWTAPAMHWVDRPHIVPRISHRGHTAALLKLVQAERIDAVIPLIDSDLSAISRNAQRFEALGCTAIISATKVIDACADKLATYRELHRVGIETPRTWSAEEIAERRRHRFPYFLKPRRGSAGQGLYRIENADELRVFLKRQPDSVVQEFVEGVEHTLDVYTGLDGVVRCVVPRRRLEVRTGEVSKGLVVKDPRVMAVGRRVVEALPGCRGVITVQCMVARGGRICVIEINPRLGGGAPLAIEAGADFPKWLMAELLGRRLRVNYEGYRDNVAMLRFDDSVFVEGGFEQGRKRRVAAKTQHKT